MTRALLPALLLAAASAHADDGVIEWQLYNQPPLSMLDGANRGQGVLNLGLNKLLLPQLDERSRRLVLGAVARAAGDGGVTAVAQAAGASWQTVADGADELASGDDAGPGRGRRPGGGRKKLEDRDPRLIPALRDLLEASTRGDPQSLITWTTLSVRGVAASRAASRRVCG